VNTDGYKRSTLILGFRALGVDVVRATGEMEQLDTSAGLLISEGKRSCST